MKELNQRTIVVMGIVNFLLGIALLVYNFYQMSPLDVLIIGWLNVNFILLIKIAVTKIKLQ